MNNQCSHVQFKYLQKLCLLRTHEYGLQHFRLQMLHPLEDGVGGGISHRFLDQQQQKSFILLPVCLVSHSLLVYIQQQSTVPVKISESSIFVVLSDSFEQLVAQTQSVPLTELHSFQLMLTAVEKKVVCGHAHKQTDYMYHYFPNTRLCWNNTYGAREA